MPDKLTKWIKPNGVEIHLNNESATISQAIDNGWELPAERKTRLKLKKKAAK